MKIYFVEHNAHFFNYLKKLTKKFNNIKGYYEPALKIRNKSNYYKSAYKGYEDLDFSNYVKKSKK